jgi:hypothetical protein
MNPPPIQTAPLPLDPIHLAVMVRATVDATPHHPDAPRRNKPPGAKPSPP